MFATRAAQSKRLELEHLVISYATIKETISDEDNNAVAAAFAVQTVSRSYSSYRCEMFYLGDVPRSPSYANIRLEAGSLVQPLGERNCQSGG
jgi:hypothetical protein